MSGFPSMRGLGVMCSKIITNKKGSYLTEAVISLPIFIIAVMVMSSVILMYACIEDCNFVAANEIRLGAAEAVIADTSITVPYRVRKEIEAKHKQIDSARLVDSLYRGSRWGIDELIAFDYRLTLSSPNPLGIKAKARYDLTLVTRAYTGRERDEESMSAEEFMDEDSEAVFIFPKRGEKYHSEGCGFLRAASRSAALTSAIKSRYRSCPLCKSGQAGQGSLIYYFPAAGDDYHLPGCASLQRNYIELDKKTAIERGYTPCSKCGG